MLCGMARIAIIGGGNIGEALLSGLLAGRAAGQRPGGGRTDTRSRQLPGRHVLGAGDLGRRGGGERDLRHRRGQAGRRRVGDRRDRRPIAAAESDSVEQVLVTVAAGVTIAYYESKLPAGTPVVRVMPNAPALVGAGVSALAKGRFATPEQLEEVSALFDAVGGVLTVPETQMDAVTAVSGSGPAYFFLLVEALVDAGVAAGLSRAGRDRSGGADDGRFGGDVAGSDGPGAAAGDGEAFGPRGHHGRAAAGDRSPHPAAPPPLGCANSNGAGCGRPSPRPSRPQKHALSS